MKNKIFYFLKQHSSDLPLWKEENYKSVKVLSNGNSQNPFWESESYYAQSSHSGHDDRFNGFHEYGGLKELFVKAKDENQDGCLKKIARKLEVLFIIGYTLSAVYDELNSTDGRILDLYPSGHDKWFHGPFSGCFWTLDAYFNGWFWDRAHTNTVIKNEKLEEDPILGKIWTTYHKIYWEFYANKKVAILNDITTVRTELERFYGELKQTFAELVKCIAKDTSSSKFD